MSKMSELSSVLDELIQTGQNLIHSAEEMKKTGVFINIGRGTAVVEDDLIDAYKYKDILITQMAVLTSLLDFAKTIKKTRGSALYYQKSGKLREGLDEIFRFIPDDGKSKDKVQEVIFDKTFKVKWRDVRPIPTEDNFFENVWRRYREDKNIF